MRVLKIRKDGREYVDDAVVEDIMFRIFVNGTLVASMNVIREKLRELTYGHLFTSGYIHKVEEVDDLSFDGNNAHVKLSPDIDLDVIKQVYMEKLTGAIPDCPQSRNGLDFSVTPSKVRAVMGELNEQGLMFRQTGGTHSALVYQNDRVLSFAEDVGRFNALDKVIGDSLLNQIDLRTVILATSGRLAGEMVLKASIARIPVMCSVSAPISSGVAIARSSSMTLIGFARDARFNVYSGFERIA